MGTTTPDTGRGGGPGGFCVCIKCGAKVAHRPGTPCRETKCPSCGATMLRGGSEHHRAFLERRGATT